jgi:DNA-binding beta-propeller fold protein YncE
MKTIKNVFSLNQLNLKTMHKEQRTMNSEQCTMNGAFSILHFQFSIKKMLGAALSLTLLVFSFFYAGCKKDGGGGNNTGGTGGKTITVSTLAGTGSATPFADGEGSAATFNYPCGIALDASGNLYVADQDNHRIRKITPAGVVSTAAGTGNSTPFTNGALNVATFQYPGEVAVDAAGNLYVAEYGTTGNNRIRLINTAGVVSTFAGTGNLTPFKDGAANTATFNKPNGIAVDTKTGRIYVADAGNNRIRYLASATVNTWAGTGSTTPFQDGAGSTATFNEPTGVAADTEGNLYIADASNHRIRKITAAGMVSTLAGTGSETPFADGAGNKATFNVPAGIALDAAGNVYVADLKNHRIRKITPDGTVSTIAGDGTANFKDGAGKTAQFNEPRALTVTPDGSTIYVVDRGNNKIRKIVIK